MSEPTVGIFDHIWHGTYFYHFKSPPKTPIDEEIQPFREEIEAMTKEKIEILRQRVNDLESEMKRLDTLIVSKIEAKEINEIDEFFMRTYIHSQREEIKYIRKWVRYWLRIREMATGQENWARQECEANGISEADLERAKEFPLEDLYEGELKQYGDRLIGCCPFHSEKTPSFMIYAGDNHYYCYGCHAWGDAVDYYSKLHQVSMIEAVRSLNAR